MSAWIHSWSIDIRWEEFWWTGIVGGDTRLLCSVVRCGRKVRLSLSFGIGWILLLWGDRTSSIAWSIIIIFCPGSRISLERPGVDHVDCQRRHAGECMYMWSEVIVTYYSRFGTSSQWSVCNIRGKITGPALGGGRGTHNVPHRLGIAHGGDRGRSVADHYPFRRRRCFWMSVHLQIQNIFVENKEECKVGDGGRFSKDQDRIRYRSYERGWSFWSPLGYRSRVWRHIVHDGGGECTLLIDRIQWTLHSNRIPWSVHADTYLFI